MGDKKIEEVRKREKRGVEGRGAVTEDKMRGEGRQEDRRVEGRGELSTLLVLSA